MRTSTRPLRVGAGLIWVALVTGACESTSNNARDGIDFGSYLPLAVGNSWTYGANDPTRPGWPAKVVSIVATERVGGTGPHHNEWAFKFDSDGTASWRALIDSRVIEYREVVADPTTTFSTIERDWDPPRLRVDETPEHITSGASWREPDYTERETNLALVDGGAPSAPEGGITVEPGIKDVWQVISASEPVTVPAGTFDALVVSRIGYRNGETFIKTYWFARGIGKVLDAGSRTPREELISYHVQHPTSSRAP